MSKHSIKFRLSDAAQKAALLSGLDARAEQTLEFPRITENHTISGSGLGGNYTLEKDDPAVLAQALELGAKIHNDGSLLLDATWLRNIGHEFATPPRDALHALQLFAEATVAARAAIQAEAAQEAQQERADKATKEAAIQATCASKPVWLLPYLNGAPGTQHPWGEHKEGDYYSKHFPERQCWEACTEFERAAVNDERLRRDAVANAKLAAARQAEIKAALDREQRLCELVRPLDASAAARIDAGGERLLGLLPESEALDILRDHVLPILEGLKAYERMRKADVCRFLEYGDDQDCGKVSFLKFEGQELPEISRDDWDAIQIAKAKLILADLGEPVLVAHRGRCENHDDCPDVWRFGLKVARDLGEGLVIEREYGV